ncbi:MAG: ABC transporter ATP-binding protein [Thermoplasmata archaeon]
MNKICKKEQKNEAQKEELKEKTKTQDDIVHDAIYVRDLVKKYGDFQALSGLNLTVKKGEIYGLLGPNGAGKTTAVKIFCGLVKYTSGTAKVLGKEVPSEEIRHQIGYMPQETAIYQDLTVHENIELFGQLYGLDSNTITKREKELLDFISLSKWRDSPVWTLSGGMKHRVSLACAMVHSPELLILDEPTVGVDPQLRTIFWEYFRKIVSEGKTILITTHYMDEAFNCTRVGLMRLGRLIAEGTPEEIVSKHKARNLEDAFLKLAKEVEE